MWLDWWRDGRIARQRSIALATTIAILLVLSLSLHASAQPSLVEAQIVVRGDGVVEAYLEVLADPGIVEVMLPAAPIASTVLVETEDGVPLVPVVEGNSLIIPLEASSQVKLMISYIVETVEQDGYISFDVNPSGELRLVVEQGVILLGLPEGVISYERIDGRLAIVFTGESTISFVPAEYATETTVESPPDGTATPTRAEEGVEDGDAKAAPIDSVLGDPFILGLIALVALALLGGAAVFFYRRTRGDGGGRSLEVETVTLDSTDREILDLLKELGGEAPQPELLRATGLPKSTLWRRLRRLENMGYIEVVKKGKFNIVKLKKYYAPGDGEAGPGYS